MNTTLYRSTTVNRDDSPAAGSAPGPLSAFPMRQPLWPADRSFAIDLLCAAISIWLVLSTKEKS